MLDRSRPDRRSRRSRRAARDRAYRQRQRDGRMAISVEVDAAVLELLVRLRWLGERDAADRRQVGEAIARLLADAARRG